MKLRRRELHEEEVSIALLTSIHVNGQRDTKKTPKPYSYKEFCFYSNGESEETAHARYGSAMLSLIKKQKFPSWALFCYNGLSKNSDPDFVPDVLAFQCDDAMLLAPVKDGTGWKGFLIAKESASEQSRVLTDERGNEIRVDLPFIETKFVAREDVTLN